ncbi:MAG TPA: flagellar export protein FliJ [Gemmatimonadaceae bacterium]|nr:flagellar export protein FliJ [Gemmatimonadaceae bacterium]
MFRFRLQQVLDLREKQERHLATQLAAALGAEREAKDALNGLRAEREAGSEAVKEGESHSVGELANLAFMMQQLDDRIAGANDTVSAANNSVSQVQEALTAAFKDRRVLDRLRERHEETYRATAEQTDRRAMDDIALSRFVHNDNGQ